MNTKACKQCGELKPVEQFRKYYGGRKGTYRTCKLCEKINARAKYIERKGDTATLPEHEELQKIYKLYSIQSTAGLQPPRASSGKTTPISESLDDMISKYESQVVASTALDVGLHGTAAAPAELQRWLTKALVEDPDYYLDEVYEALKVKYRPLLRIFTANMLPVYDDTYKVTLEQILDRFNKYEDACYDKE